MRETNYVGKTVYYGEDIYEVKSFTLTSEGYKLYQLENMDGLTFGFEHEIEVTNPKFWQDKEYMMALKTAEKVVETQRGVLEKLEKGDTAKRFNAGKPQLSMIDSEILNLTAQVLEFGAQKYDRDNWKKGLSTSSVMDSLLRHAHALADGEENDEESGISHLGHIVCNAMFIAYYKKKGLDND